MKIIIAISFILFIALLILPPDVNFDGKVNALDCAYITWHIVGKHELSPIQKLRADVDKDGKIDQNDVDLITDIILGR